MARGRNGLSCNESRKYWFGMELPWNAPDAQAKELLVRCFRPGCSLVFHVLIILISSSKEIRLCGVHWEQARY